MSAAPEPTPRDRAALDPSVLLRSHASSRAVLRPHAGVTTALSVAFSPDELRFDRGLTSVLLGVPTRPLETDAHCQLLGSTTGLRGQLQTDGAPRGRSELILIDAEQPYAIRYGRGRSPAIDFLYIDPGWLADLGAQVTDGSGIAPGLSTDLKLRDAALQDAATRYVASLDSEGSRLWRDALRHRLGVQLLLRHALAPPRSRVRCHPLAPSRLRRIDDYIAAHLGQDLGLAELAALTGLSRHQFLRSFQRSTGYTPHQYVMARRIERAASLLRATPLSIVDVASSTGFSSQAHLTTLFRRHRGLTPHQYRALRRG